MAVIQPQSVTMAMSTVQQVAHRFLQAAATATAVVNSTDPLDTSDPEPSSSPPSSSSSSSTLDLLSTTTMPTSNTTMKILNDTAALALSGQSNDNANYSTTNFDPKVFWSVNAFIFVLLISTVVVCCFAKKEWFTYDRETGRMNSDEQYRQTVLQRQRQQQQSKVETPAQRTRRLLRSFKRHQVEMIVTEDDIVEEDSQQATGIQASCAALEEDHESDVELGVREGRSDEDDDTMHEAGHLRLKNGSLVPNCCAICLMGYDIGDKVIWSSNPDCAHAFHEDCVVGWLVKMQPETPCPCCRQEFTDLEILRKERKIKWTGPAFNPNVVSFSPSMGTSRQTQES